MRSKSGRFLFATFMACMFAGCAENKFTRSRFDMVKEGTSTKDEVRLTLGDKYMSLGDNQWEFEDEEKHLHATIHFNDHGVVTKKEWMDGKTGEWSGSAPGIQQTDPNRTASQGKSHTTIDK